jgi:hypothetical protein
LRQFSLLATELATEFSTAITRGCGDAVPYAGRNFFLWLLLERIAGSRGAAEPDRYATLFWFILLVRCASIHARDQVVSPSLRVEA